MKRWYLGVMILFLLAGCAQPTPAAPPMTATPAASPVPAASATPTPLPGVLMVYSAAAPDAATNALIKAQAAGAGLTLDERTDVQPADLKPEVKAVLLLDTPANLNDLLAAAPQVQFVLLTGADIESAANLSVIRMRAEDQAFMAGYLASIITNNWRAAGLIAGDKDALKAAFVNGGGYFCGTCSPGWPLKVYYPVVGSADAPGDGNAWAATAQVMVDTDKVDVLYLSTDAALPEVYTYLAGRKQLDNDVIVVGSFPPPTQLSNQWAVTVQLDALEALKQVLPQALAGKSAGKVNVAVTLTDVNYQLLSAGRLEQAKQVLADLATGVISPSNP